MICHLGVSQRCCAPMETLQERGNGHAVHGGWWAGSCSVQEVGVGRCPPGVCAVIMDALVLLLAFFATAPVLCSLHGQCNMLPPLLSPAASPHAKNEAGLRSCSPPSLPSRSFLASALIRSLLPAAWHSSFVMPWGRFHGWPLLARARQGASS